MQLLRSTLLVLVYIAQAAACSQSGDEGETNAGRKAMYPLLPGSEWEFEGTVVLSENQDSTARLEITLEGTEGDRLFPIHLHHGAYGQLGEVAAFLEPLSAENGSSITAVVTDADGRPFSFDELLIFDGHIKVHLSHVGAGKDIVLAYGNIGIHAAFGS